MADHKLPVASSPLFSPPAGAGRLPKYGLHKPSGRAVIYLARRPVYLGSYDSPESWERYWQLVAQFPTPGSRKNPVTLEAGDPISIALLVERYLAHAVEYYGQGSERLYTIRSAIRPLLELHASTKVTAFGPLALEGVRTHRVNQGRISRTWKNGEPAEWRPISRVYINELVQIIIRIFDWGVSRELVPETIANALVKLPRIQKGREPKVKESKPVKPVPAEHVEAVLNLVSTEIAGMIRIQILTAMRPDEVTAIRPCDIDTTGKIWIYTLGDRSHGGVGHKTDHLDDEGDKYVCLGPKAQEIIRPLIATCEPTEFLFSPKRATKRRFPNGHGGLKPRDRYDDGSYCQAVKRACRRAGVPVWTPNRLRHNRATEVRMVFGLEAAQAVLDHRNIQTTQIYAQKKENLKREVALKIG
jgi:integrase